MIGELDHGVGQQLQRPASAASRRVRAGRRHQQGFLLARLLAQRIFRIAFHKASLGSTDGGAAHRHDPDDLLVAASRIGGQQDLGSFELAGGMLAAAQHRVQFSTLGLAHFDPVT